MASDPLKDPLKDPANATLADLVRHARATAAKRGGTGGSLRMALIEEESGENTVTVLISVGTEAVKWTKVLDEVFAGRQAVAQSVVRTSTDLEAPAVPLDGFKQ